MATWQPHQQGLRELLILLRDAVRPDAQDHAVTNQRLEMFNQVPDYNAYLIHILTRMPQEEAYTRALAGLTLKNNLRFYFNAIPPTVLDHVKSCCIEALETPDPDINVRNTIGSVITAVVTHGQVHNWPQILQVLVTKLDSQDPLVVEMALDALKKICEDSARDLDQDIGGVQPLQFMIPKLVQFFHHNNVKFRIQAISATSQFIPLRSQALVNMMDVYLNGLFTNTSDQNPELRQEICRSLALILQSQPETLEPSIHPVIEYMIFCTCDENEQVAFEACDFWTEFANLGSLQAQLVPYLERIVPALLHHMAYSDNDLLLLGGDEDDVHIPDQIQDIRPHTSRHRGRSGRHTHEDGHDHVTRSRNDNDNGDGQDEDDQDDIDDDDDDDDDDEFYSEWTLRKCSAVALDTLSSTYPEHVVNQLLPLLSQILVSDQWRTRESGILALGAVAEGGITYVAPHLPQMIPFLLECLNDTKPLIRSITCWALSRFAAWCIEQATTPEGHARYFEPVLFALLQRILDRNKRVQEAACSAFATFEEEATMKLVPYLTQILTHISTAFESYQNRNLVVLYDVLGTLAESVGPALNHRRCLELLMPPLIARWNDLSDQDPGLLPLLECLSTVTAALGAAFAPFSEPVFTRCINIVASTLHETVLAHQQPEDYDLPDVDLMVSALDLLSGLVQGMGELIDPLIAQSQPPVLSLIAVCIHDPVADVLQSTYALIGDLSEACFHRLHGILPTIMNELVEHMIPDLQNVSVCNNAIWAAGQIAIQWRDGMQPFTPPLVERLLPLLTEVTIPESLIENVVITIGRLGYACPGTLGPLLPQYIQPWLQQSISIREDKEKETAFIGLCNTIRTNPTGIGDQLSFLIEIIARYQHPSRDLTDAFGEILNGYRNLDEGRHWNPVWANTADDVRQLLSQRYSPNA